MIGDDPFLTVSPFPNNHLGALQLLCSVSLRI
jgi:hypothetical protein